MLNEREFAFFNINILQSNSQEVEAYPEINGLGEIFIRYQKHRSHVFVFFIDSWTYAINEISSNNPIYRQRRI